MKTRKRLILILVGIAIAVITAGVPIAEIENKSGYTEVKALGPCYGESEIVFMMEMSNVDRPEAMEALEVACMYPVKPKNIE